jgi:hypothetical protein
MMRAGLKLREIRESRPSTEPSPTAATSPEPMPAV